MRSKPRNLDEKLKALVKAGIPVGEMEGFLEGVEIDGMFFVVKGGICLG